MVACMVLAFAKPFIPLPDNISGTSEDPGLVVYIDNSFSMQARSEEGELFTASVQKLVDILPEDQQVTILFNDRELVDLSHQELVNELLTTTYSSKQLTLEEIFLKAKSLGDATTQTDLLLVSDFQTKTPEHWMVDSLESLSPRAIKLSPESFRNISLDTATITQRNTNAYNLKLYGRRSNDTLTTSIALMEDGRVVTRTAALMDEGRLTATLPLPQHERFAGYMESESSGLSYDNRLYITLNKSSDIKVLDIVPDEKMNYLAGIFQGEEFDYQRSEITSLNYRILADQNTIILNGINSIPAALASEVSEFIRAGGTLVFIPGSSMDGSPSSVPGLGDDWNTVKTDEAITSINFDHPIFKDVFNSRVQNFQYPEVNRISQRTQAPNSILNFASGNSFLYQNRNTFVFTAPLSDVVSNFQDSPLIVPIFINIALQSLQPDQLFYRIGERAVIDVEISLGSDEVLSIKEPSGQRLIPRQTAYANRVQVVLDGDVNQPGIYSILDAEGNTVKQFAMNYDRTESFPVYASLEDLDQIETAVNLETLLTDLTQENSAEQLWKYFILGALLFLLIELLLLRLL